MKIARSGHYQYVLADGKTTRPCVCVHWPSGKSADDGIGNFQVFLNSSSSEQGIGVNGIAYVTNVPFKPFNFVAGTGTPNTVCAE